MACRASGDASMKMDRKDFFKTGLSETVKSLYNTKIGGIVDRQLQSFANVLAPFSEPHDQPPPPPPPEATKPEPKESPQPPTRRRGFARPPGSVRDPERFKQICTECGDCIIACPYGAIIRAPGVYGPIVNPNMVACALCEDYPCIQACDEKALLPIPDGFLPKFGHAMVEPQLCRNVQATQPKKAAKKAKKSSKKASKSPRKKLCSTCVDVCPIPDAVALLKGPVKIPAFAHHCTGCGLCVQDCPESALRIEYA